MAPLGCSLTATPHKGIYVLFCLPLPTRQAFIFQSQPKKCKKRMDCLEMIFTGHAMQRLFERQISIADVKAIIETGEVMYHRQSRWLEFLNRSKRLKTWGHLKVAIQTNLVGQYVDLRAPAFGYILARHLRPYQPLIHSSLWPKSAALQNSSFDPENSGRSESHFCL